MMGAQLEGGEHEHTWAPRADELAKWMQCACGIWRHYDPTQDDCEPPSVLEFGEATS